MCTCHLLVCTLNIVKGFKQLSLSWGVWTKEFCTLADAWLPCSSSQCTNTSLSAHTLAHQQRCLQLLAPNTGYQAKHPGFTVFWWKLVPLLISWTCDSLGKTILVSDSPNKRNIDISFSDTVLAPQDILATQEFLSVPELYKFLHFQFKLKKCLISS